MNGEKDQRRLWFCRFVCFYLFSCFMFLQDVFINVFRETNGRGKRFYDRELALPTWRTMMMCPFSLRWWSQLWRSLLLLFYWRLLTPLFYPEKFCFNTVPSNARRCFDVVSTLFGRQNNVICQICWPFWYPTEKIIKNKIIKIWLFFSPLFFLL